MSGGPDGAPDAPAAPIPAAFLKAMTVSSPSKPLRWGVAVTTAFDRVLVAFADQISASPACVLLRLTRVQLRPPPLTVACWEPGELGPSTPTNARICSPAAVVVNPGELSVPLPCLNTSLSIEMTAGGGALLSAVTSTPAEVPVLPAASTASALIVCAPGVAARVSQVV